MSLISITPKDMADIVKVHATALKLPAGSSLDPVKLLWALCGNETSFGANILPHHEAGYCPFTNGAYYKNNPDVRHQTALIGCLAHMSYGPLQVMWFNIVKFYYDATTMGPQESLAVALLTDPNRGMNAAVAFLNKEILGRQGCKTLDEIGDAYNSGNAKDKIIPVDYITKLKANYDVPLKEN